MDYFSKDDLKNEIRGYMWALAACLERAYFPGCSWALLGLDSNDFPGQRIEDLAPDAIDISRFLVTDVLMELYDYGINGERRRNWNWIDLATDTLAFIDGLRHFLLLHEGSVDYQLELSSHVLAVADARDKLDEEEGHTDARPGMLTCRHHYEYETEAQSLKKAREAINSASGTNCRFPD